MAASSSSAPATTDIYKSFPSLKGRTAKFTSTAPFTPTYIQAHTPTNSSSYTNRIQGHQILLENPARESQDKKDRDARRARQKRDGARRKAGIISRADAKRLGAWKLDRNACKYDTFLPIHHMWCSYIAELLNLQQVPLAKPEGPPREHRIPNSIAMQAKLVKAEFHGAILEVSQSRNASLVGCRGIVIHETANTFKIITSDNALKQIPKENTIFAVDIPLYAPPLLDLSTFRLPVAPTISTSSELTADIPPPGSPILVDNPVTVTHPSLPPSSPMATFLESTPKIRFDLYGNHFRFTPADRATRKFKPKETIEI